MANCNVKPQTFIFKKKEIEKEIEEEEEEERKKEYAPPVSGLSQPNVPDIDISATEKPHKAWPTLIPGTRPGVVPAHHHILDLIFRHHKLHRLPVDDSSARDPHVGRVLRQHHVPPRGLLRVVLDPRASQEGGVFVDVEGHARFQPDGGCQVFPRREVDLAWFVAGGTRVDG